MSRSKKIWIPAVIAAVIAVLLVAYYLYWTSTHGGGEPRPRPSGEGMRRLPENDNERYGGYFKTLGTISVFLGAASFSWFWFKKKLKSPSALVRKAGKLLHSVHKLMGWITLILVAIHGTYFLITKLHDSKIYTGLAGFAILLTLAGYGYSINKVRNKFMRTVHRSLGILWVPVLLLHAGGSVILAILACLAVWGLIWIFERANKYAKD